MRATGRDFDFDFARNTFKVADGTARLTAKESCLLRALVANQGTVQERDDLVTVCALASIGALSTMMSALRRKLEGAGRLHIGSIQTHGGMGFSWKLQTMISDTSPNGSPRPGNAEYGEFLSYLQEKLQDNREIIVSHMKDDWGVNLLASICLFRSAGGRFLVNDECPDKQRRFLLLRALGCSVVRVARTGDDFVGVVYDGANPRDGEIYTYSDGAFRSSKYHKHRAFDDPVVVRVCHGHAAAPHSGASIGERLLVDRFDCDKMLDLVRSAELYVGKRVSLEPVEINTLIPTQAEVAPFKLTQGTQILRFYERHNWQPFEPIAARLGQAGASPLVPPIAERRDGKLYLVDGHSRVLATRQYSARKQIMTIVVEDVFAPLPGAALQDWNNVKLTHGEHEVRPEPAINARRVDRAVHAPLIKRLEELARE